VLPIILTDFCADINHHDGKKITELLLKISCAKCGHQQCLKLTKARVRRPAITLGDITEILVPLSKCDVCSSRRRLLPMELLPWKPYALPTMQKFIAAYNASPHGWRRTVNDTPGGFYKPHFTTVHGWASGLGERALDQVKLNRVRAMVNKPPFLEPFTTLFQTVESRHGLPAVKAFSAEVTVFPEKYRSQRRKEHLEANLRLLNLAALIPAHREEREPQSLLLLEEIALAEFHRPLLLFRSRIREPSIQHRF
jgi:hypothetical protein